MGARHCAGALREERAVREAAVTEKNRHGVQTQRERKPKKGGKVTRVGARPRLQTKYIASIHWSTSGRFAARSYLRYSAHILFGTRTGGQNVFCMKVVIRG